MAGRLAQHADAVGGRVPAVAAQRVLPGHARWAARRSMCEPGRPVAQPAAGRRGQLQRQHVVGDDGLADDAQRGDVGTAPEARRGDTVAVVRRACGPPCDAAETPSQWMRDAWHTARRCATDGDRGVLPRPRRPHPRPRSPRTRRPCRSPRSPGGRGCTSRRRPGWSPSWWLTDCWSADPTARSAIGVRMWELASRASPTLSLRDAAMPFLEDVHAVVGPPRPARRPGRRRGAVRRAADRARRGHQLLAGRRPAAAARHLVRAGPARLRATRAAGADPRRRPGAVHRQHPDHPGGAAGRAHRDAPSGLRPAARPRARGGHRHRGPGPQRPRRGGRRTVGDRAQRRPRPGPRPRAHGRRPRRHPHLVRHPVD